MQFWKLAHFYEACSLICSHGHQILHVSGDYTRKHSTQTKCLLQSHSDITKYAYQLALLVVYYYYYYYYYIFH